MTEKSILQKPFELRLGDGGIIRGEVRVANTPGRRPAVLIAHGFKGFKDWGFLPYTAEKIALAGFCAVTFNFSRNGVSDQEFDEPHRFGLNTYSREQADLDQVLTALLQQELPFADKLTSSKVGIIGHSRGGGNAIIFAAEHHLVRAVVTWNGIARANLFDAEFEQKARTEGVAYVTNARTNQELPIRREFFEDLDKNRDRFDIPARLSGLGIPVLQVQADDDSPRLLQGFQLLREAAPHQPVVRLEGTGHTFGAVHPFEGATPALQSALEATTAFLKASL